MSIFRETKRIGAVQTEVMQGMDPDDASLRPVHFPHAVAYWAIGMQRGLLESLSDADSDFDAQRQMMQEAFSIAFMTGYKYAKDGFGYSDCGCGKLTANSVEELMSDAWRHEFNRTHPNGRQTSDE